MGGRLPKIKSGGDLYLPNGSPESPAQLKIRREAGRGDEERKVCVLKVGNVVEKFQAGGAAVRLSQHGRLVQAVNVGQVREVTASKA